MKNLRSNLLLCVLICGFLAFFDSAALAQCGVERWSVKTGTDADAGQVGLNSTLNTTISYLDGLPAPNPIPPNNRVAPTETTVWVINATLTKYKIENDSDYHLVLDDGAGHTMIAEIPSPSCVGASSPFASGIAHARAQFDAVYTATSSFQTVSVPVQVTGVGMFDFLHGQTGVAPNAIELHPVIDIIFNPSTSSDFSLAVSPASLSVAPNSSAMTNVTTSVSGNFSSAISLAATNVPSGVSVSFNSATIASPGAGSATMTVAASQTAAAGTYTITVTGTGGGKSHSANLNLTVTSSGGGTTQLLGNPGFENGSSSPAPWTTSSGVIDSSTGEPAHSSSWKAWLNGYGSSHTDTIAQSVAIPSNVSIATLSFWLHIDTAETTATAANDTLSVRLLNSSGAVLTTLATYSNLNVNAGYRQVSFDVSAYRGQTVQISLTGTENSQLQTSFVVDDFALNVSSSGGGGGDTTPPTARISAPANNATVSGTTNVTAIASDNVGVTKLEIYLDGSLQTSNTNQTTLSYSWNTTNVANGSHTLAAKAYDAAGNVGTSSAVNVTVSNPSGGTTTELIVNNGFENTVSGWTLGGAKIPISSSARKHGGSYSLRAGATTAAGSAEPNGDSSAYQTISIPANATSATLTFWYSTATTDTIQYDWQEAKILDASGNTLQQIFKIAQNNPAWTQSTVDLKSYAGRTIRIYFNCHGDGATDPTTLWVDDVSVKVTQ